MKREQSINKIKRMTGVAMFAALAYVSVILVRIPNVAGFLTLDFKDAIIIICGMFFGPASAVTIAFLVPFLEFLTVSGTGVYGLIMNVTSSIVFALTASLIYKYKKTLLGAIVGLLCGVFAVTSIMMLANLVITPYYMGMSVEAVAKQIPKVLLPFNFVKAVLNASLAIMLYKPLTLLMRKTGFFGVKREQHMLTPEEKRKNIVRSVVMSSIALLIVILSMTIIMMVWKGQLSFFDVFKK